MVKQQDIKLLWSELTDEQKDAVRDLGITATSKLVARFADVYMASRAWRSLARDCEPSFMNAWRALYLVSALTRGVLEAESTYKREVADLRKKADAVRESFKPKEAT